MSQVYCTSCGLPIPNGQGRSCSMCYGDIDYGRDGYYRQWAEEQFEKIRLSQELCDVERQRQEE
jgi:hypothetical protein